ncbi:MAG: ACT domain-containing protein [Ruminococcaceae bacterium]|nr:ACT domain-containing protein [Oscillospiraceae bacterium]
MNAIISVTGKDSVGIIAKVSSECAKYKVNISDISQTVLQDYFVMIMLADIRALEIPFTEFVDKMKQVGVEMNLSVLTMHEDIFNSMHRI